MAAHAAPIDHCIACTAPSKGNFCATTKHPLQLGLCGVCSWPLQLLQDIMSALQLQDMKQSLAGKLVTGGDTDDKGCAAAVSAHIGPACHPCCALTLCWRSIGYALLQAFADKLVEVVSMDDDYVWLHDYHLLVLPSLLRKRFNRIRLGLFLHSPFPSSEIFRTFPRREEILRSLLNADLVGEPHSWPLAAPALCNHAQGSSCVMPCGSSATGGTLTSVCAKDA